MNKTIYIMTIAALAMVLRVGARTETRWSECVECAGTGKVKCADCNGEGWTPMLGEKPSLVEASFAVLGTVIQAATVVVDATLTGETETADHMGHYQCQACNKRGRVKCKACDGVGRVGRSVYVPDPQPARRQPESNYRKVLPSIAIIHAQQGGYTWSGTGFVARDGGTVYLYTNRHVIMHDGGYADTLRAVFVDGCYIDLTPQFSMTAEDRRDVVRFRVTGCDDRALTIYSKGPTQGERVFVYGNSLGRDVVTEAKGRILGVGIGGLMEHDCDTAQGNSGSPILDVNLEVVGIDTMSRRDEPDEDTVLAGSRYYCIRNFGTSIVGVTWN